MDFNTQRINIFKKIFNLNTFIFYITITKNCNFTHIPSISIIYNINQYYKYFYLKIQKITFQDRIIIPQVFAEHPHYLSHYGDNKQ